MANTTKLTDRSLQIKGLDADWSTPGDLGADYNDSGLRVKAILFYPSAAGDVIIIKEGSAALNTTALAIAQTAVQPQLMAGKSVAGETLRVDFGDRGQQMRPFIDITDCTFGTAANARVEFQLA